MSALTQRLGAIAFDMAMAPLESARLRRVRRALLRRASGRVLELGAGSGANLPYYDWRRVSSLTVSDRDDMQDELRRRAHRHVPQHVAIESRQIDAGRVPAADAAFDTIVATLLFCSVECPPCGFDEIARLLAPGGRYLFLEHVRPAHDGMARVFDTINPVWNAISHGCNLNRDTVATLANAGFTIEHSWSGGSGVFVWGVAAPPASVGRGASTRS